MSSLPDFAQLVHKAAPAVVSITGVRVVKGESGSARGMPDLPPGSPLGQFFKHFFGPNNPYNQPFESKERILGSGFIISPDGYIVTNRHVVVGDTELKVRLLDRHEYSAKVIGMDKRTDLALLKIDAKDLPTLPLGDSSNLQVGQWVLAIGNPFGFDYTATQGIISALSRNLPDENYVPFIQTDAAVNPGNSGGPLLNLKGQVVGVNSQIYTNSGGFMGLSFAIPINIVKDVINQIKAHGKVSYGWLGVMVQGMNQSLAQSFGLQQPTGALVARVEPGSPAAKAGFKSGDIILKFDGHPVVRSGDLPPLVGSTPVGTVVPVEILRNDKHMTLTVKIGKLSEQAMKASSEPDQGDQGHGRLGVAVETIPKDQLGPLGLKHDAVVIKSINPNGAAAQNGLQVGDIILEFNRHRITSAAELNRLVREAPAGKPIPILILRDKTPLFAAITLPK
ncbi:hypothetical protein BJI67_08640 [Acidihalobacter aeolianus]|uniref:Probable periplasmic serine endoprotease DegP-like n=1 Tax=Acidihalobacter aeolianus TaxID=2792603 RepID=A0A1D8KC52_9GAMM|nr:hypothetical protein BJI67_08640 [Acidihalobacter aeolianus]